MRYDTMRYGWAFLAHVGSGGEKRAHGDFAIYGGASEEFAVGYLSLFNAIFDQTTLASMFRVGRRLTFTHEERVFSML